MKILVNSCIREVNRIGIRASRKLYAAKTVEVMGEGGRWGGM